MSCKLTANVNKTNCSYQVAGLLALYLINFDTANKWTLEEDNEKIISAILLAGETDKAFKLEFSDGSASFTDELATNGNGGKYRTHTVNFTLSEYDYNILNQGDALSLGKFTAVVVDKNRRCIVLGRNNGLSATSFNYASGAADADSSGWATVLAGTETEIGKLLKDESVITSIVSPVVITP